MKIKITLNDGHEIRIEKDYLTPNQLRDLIRKEYLKYLDGITKEFIQESKQVFSKHSES